MTALPHETSGLAGHAEETLEVVPIKVAARLFLGVIGHEVDDEVVCSRYLQQSGVSIA